MKPTVNTKVFKTFSAETKIADKAPRTLVVKITTPTEDRAHDTVQPAGMDASNFLKNPVVLMAHQYDQLPIAKCTGLTIQDAAVLATVEFPEEGMYPLADTVFEMYKQNFMSAWSIGFMPKEAGWEENDLGGYNYKSWELFEFSAVPVPANPEALTVMRSKGINVDLLLEKGVIAYKDTGKAPEDEAWDAGAEVKAASVEDLKIMCTWFDSENADNKGGYKLPHHKQTGGHAAVWRGVAAAMGAVLGARGGTNIPEGDRKGVYGHLAKHYAEFDKEVPEFKSYTEAELTEVFPEEKEVTEVVVKIADADIVVKKLDEAAKIIEELATENAQLKAGRVLSGKNESLVKECMDCANQCVDMMDKICENMQTLLDSVAVQESTDEGKAMSKSTIAKLSDSLKKSDKSIGLTLRLLKTVESES